MNRPAFFSFVAIAFLCVLCSRTQFLLPALGEELPKELIEDRVVIAARHSGMSMDVENAGGHLSLVQTAGMGGQSNREWMIVPALTEGKTVWYTVTDSHSKCEWDIRDAGREGALLQVATPGKGPIQANRLFKFERLENGFFLISPKHTGFSLDVVDAGGVLAKIQTQPGHSGLKNREWELIPVEVPSAPDIEMLGSKANRWRVAIRGWTGYNLCADDTAPVKANREWANTSEQFDLVHVGDGYFALQSHRNKKWLRFDDNSVAATSSAVGDYEKFEILYPPSVEGEDKVSIIAMKLKRSGRFVTTEGNTGSLTANRKEIGLWECFRLDLKSEYDSPFETPAGVEKVWVEAGDFRKIAWGIGTGIEFDVWILEAAPDSEARAQYFITPNGSPRKKDAADALKIHVAGLFGEVALRPPYASYVYWSSSGIRLMPAAAAIGPIRIKF